MKLSDILSRPIAFHRVFVTLTGSVNAAIMLSQAFYWSQRSTTEAGWFYKTREDWEQETGLTRYEQEGARKLLVSSGVWQEERRGVPAKMFFKINENAIFGLIIQKAENPQTDAFSLQETHQPDGGKTPDILLSKTTTENMADSGMIKFKDRPNVEAIVIDHLNKIKKRYGIKGEIRWTKERAAMIKARLKDWPGEHPAKEIQAMFENRCKVWKGTEWEKFIRIETLFQPKKFFGYMEEAEAAPDKDWAEMKASSGFSSEDIDASEKSATEKYSGLW